MDQEIIDTTKTKDLAQTNTIQAIELPSLNIITKLSKKDLEFIENEVLPLVFVQNIKTRFSLFSEEWKEYFNGEEKKEIAVSTKIAYKYYLLQNQNVTFQNKLTSNVYSSYDNFKVIVNEARKEVIFTDGEVLKNEKKILSSADDLFKEIYQDIEIINPSYMVVLNREKKTNPYGRWEHHDEIQFFMQDRIKLDYLRMYLGSISTSF